MRIFHKQLETMIGVTVLAFLASAAVVADDEASSANADDLKAEGAVIGKIVLESSDVFDTSDPKEDNFYYRLANKWHIMTRDDVIRKQLLLAPGDRYTGRLAAESERILRSKSYLFDAEITAKNNPDGTVDLTVATRDLWTLKPSVSVSRKGGENKTSIGIEELNLLGRGQTIRAERVDDVDRTSKYVEFHDPHFGTSWVSTYLRAADNSDGDSYVISLVRPFYALDSRWSAGVTAVDDERRSALYDLGNAAAEYRHTRRQLTAFGGWSAGLRNGWTRRYTAGVVFDDNDFSAVIDGTLPAAVPADRDLVYPFFGIELVQDKFDTTLNKNQIGKTEDFFTGTRLAATVGIADESIGADRRAVLYTASYGRGFGSLDDTALLVSAWARGRQESGESKNALIGFNARYYRQQSSKRVFYATISGAHGHDLDLDKPVEIGGDTGLRGYPLRYQSGDSRLLLALEQRYYWDWYPFRLFRVGGAVFADVGRTWGENPLGSPSAGWLRDVGLGLRFASTRTSTGKVVHLDLAFPLDGDASIDEVQILLESKSSF